jgi:hypothetical protein
MRLLGWMTLSREFEPFLCMQAATSLSADARVEWEAARVRDL